MAMPLEGIRILDWTGFQQGPVATALLADMGAEVIKIEDPRGDPARGLLRMMGMDIPLNFYFENQNRGKKSITLDLRKEGGRQVIYKLVEKSDIFATNFRYEVAQRLKVDYETLVQYNPRLIYGYASGWGSEGPDKDKEAFDIAGQARGGIMANTLAPGGFPCVIGSGFADEAGGVMLAYGLMLALFARERTGVGQMVDASLLGAVIEIGRLFLQAYLTGNIIYTVPAAEGTSNPLWRQYKCQDGKWVVLSMLQPDRYWSQFCKAVGIEHLEKDPKFKDQKARNVTFRELMAILENIFITKPRDEWMKVLEENECIIAPVNDYTEVAKDPQVLANKYIVEVDDPRKGKARVVGIPVKLSKTPGQVRGLAPELGQHTEEVLIDICGYTWDDITKLRDEGVY